MLSSTILIIGSGPVGLWLAYELRNSNPDLDVLVIDRIPSRSQRSKYSKALAFSAVSLETFHSRGVAKPFLETGTKFPKAHFGGLPVLLKLDVLGAKYQFNLAIPQAKTEEILLGLCDAVGVRFVWGVDFVSLVQDGKGVIVMARRISDDGDVSGDVDGMVQIDAKWVVGCDGTHSNVRQTAGIKFEGTASTMTSVLADFQLERKPPGGLVMGKEGSRLIPLGDGVYYRATQAAQSVSAKDTPLPDMEDIKAFLREAFGDDFGAHSPLWISRFGNACRVALSFREDRVLLAGDAAHQIFPAGGQNMNLGFQDATSLAWRLAMIEKGVLPSEDLINSLLNSYTNERLVVAQAIIHNVQAQMALFKKDTASEIAIRDVFCEMLKNPDINAMWARRMTGFGDPPEAFRNEIQDDELVGERTTKLVCGDMLEEVFRVTRLEKFVLLERKKMDLEAVSKGWSDCLTRISGAGSSSNGWENVSALLIRPDMRIAWVARPETTEEEVKTSLVKVLEHWFGVRA